MTDTVTLRPGYHRPDLPADRDVRIVMPNVRRTGGLDLIGRGRSAHLNDIDLGSSRIIAAGNFNELHLSGLRGDFRSARSDGIDLACVARTVAIQNCRITGIAGHHKGFHGDGVQVQVGARIDMLAITNTTIASAYQAVMSSANTKGEGVKTLYLERVNIRDEPTLRSERSFALYLGDRPGDGVNTAPYSIVLRDVWVDWPDPKRHMFLPIGAQVIGTINRGIPPGGDFCK